MQIGRQDAAQLAVKTHVQGDEAACVCQIERQHALQIVVAEPQDPQLRHAPKAERYGSSEVIALQLQLPEVTTRKLSDPLRNGAGQLSI